MVDPIVSGAGKSGTELFREASKQLQNANDQVSKFEELRSKLEQQDMTAGKTGGENFQLQKSQDPNAVNQINQPNQIDPLDPTRKAGEIPKVTDMEGLEKVVDRLKAGQNRLRDLINNATSGKTFSPQELLALQAEVSQITNEIQLCSKIVEQGVSSVKSTMQMQV